MESPCSACGASWECEHRTDSERARLVYVQPDGPTPRKQFQKSVAAIDAAGAAIRGLASSVQGAAESLRRFKVAWDAMWDAMSEAEKEEFRRLDASS